MIELDLQLVIGKRRTGDFAVLYPPQLSITSESARLPASWLQVHASHSTLRSVSLWRQDDQVTLGCAWQESGVDDAGRPLHKLIAYRVRTPLPYGVAARLILWLYRQDFEGEPPPARREVDLGGLIDEDLPLVVEERDFAAAALALLESGTCRAQGTRTAQSIVDVLGFDQIGFLALVPGAVPLWPTAGPGVVLSRAAWHAPPDAKRLVGMGLHPDAIDLSGLMRMPKDKARRKALAIAALTGDCSTLGPPSDQELGWLMAQSRSRAAALAQASAHQIGCLVADSRIDAAAVGDLAPEQLREVPPPALAAALRGRPDAIARFAAVFGFGADGIEELLPERAASLARAARGSVAEPERILDLTGGELDLMDQAGIFGIMSLRWLTALRATRPQLLLDRHLSSRLRGLLPEPLLSRLIGLPGDAPAPMSITGTPPDPRAEWLSGIAFERLVDAGSLCINDRAWRRWWTDAVRAHPDARGRDIATLSAPWSRETASWLAASVRDGDISVADLRGRIAAFVGAQAPAGTEAVAELLGVAGLTRADVLAHVVLGMAPQGAIDASVVAEMRGLLAAGILTSDKLRAARHAGLPVTALAALTDDAASVALLEGDAPAPVQPPPSWHPLLTEELQQRMSEPGFWRRWPDGVQPPLLDWMRGHVEGQPEETIVAALIAARQRARLLRDSELALLSGALAPLDLVWQVVEHARTGDCARANLLALVDGGRLRPDLALFLRSELGALAPAAPVPEFTAAEMLAVHALLHPARDVVRQIMSRPSDEPEEIALLSLTVATIRRAGSFLPLPAPAAEQAARRPGWVAALAELPGWEHWRGAAEQKWRI